MIKTKIKKLSILTLSAVMSVGMMVGSFNLANVNAAEPAADEAQITVGKTLTINGTKWPNIENFGFELEAVKGYTNPNASTSVDGQSIGASAVPMPEGSTNNKKTINVGSFKTATTGDTATARTRTNAFDNIKYTTAGYYMYKLKEVIPNPKVSGVVYDESSYFVVVYVVNEVDNNGNTTNGVHVESITAWHNDKDSEAYQPNLKDIANHGVANGDDNSGDNNGQASKPNATYGNNPAGAQRWDDLEKVGVSTSQAKNKLDAYKFWNRQEMHDISLTKNVKGNLGDTTKEFEFTVTMTNLEAGQTYSVVKTGTPTLVSATKGSVDNSASTFTASADGEATFLVKIKDDQGITIKDLPNSVTYQASEAASNHIPSYAVTSSNTSTTEGQKAVIAKASDSTSDQKETALATAVETVDSTDGNITIAYTNTRDLETITGIPDMAIYFGIAGIVALIAFAAVRRRKDNGIAEL